MTLESKKAQAGWPPTERLTWQSQLRAYIRYKHSCTIMELRMYHGALLLLNGPVLPTLLYSYIRPTCYLALVRPPLGIFCIGHISLALHIPLGISISLISHPKSVFSQACGRQQSVLNYFGLSLQPQSHRGRSGPSSKNRRK